FEEPSIQSKKSATVREKRLTSSEKKEYSPEAPKYTTQRNPKHKKIIDQVSKVLAGMSPSKIDNQDLVQSFCLDDNGYLFDDEGNFVLDEKGNKVQLTSDQVQVFQPYEVRD